METKPQIVSVSYPQIVDNSVNIYENIERISVEGILSRFGSGIGLDIAKNHTGVCIWNGKSIELYGFALNEYDAKDVFAEAKMRRNLREKLTEITKDKEFEIAIVEGAYGGENFDTVRKLLALNTVFDDMLLDGVCTAKVYKKWKQVEWSKYTRKIYKQGHKPTSKVETQGILEYLQFPYYLEHKDDTKKEKEHDFFEDKCDAVGMLLGLALSICIEQEGKKKEKPLRVSDLTLYYLHSIDDVKQVRNKKLRENIDTAVKSEIRGRYIEREILSFVGKNAGNICIFDCPTSKLGTFGIKHNFMYYEDGKGVLIAYKKGSLA